MDMALQSPKPPRLRCDLRPGDLGRVLLFHGVCYRQEFGWDHTFEGYVAESLARFALSYDPGRERLWLAEDGDQLAGCIAIVAHDPQQAQLRWFLVDPAWRGQGLGRTLFDEAIQFARDCGYGSVFLWTVSGLQAAAHLYRSAGFVRTEQDTHELWGDRLTEERYDLRL